MNFITVLNGILGGDTAIAPVSGTLEGGVGEVAEAAGLFGGGWMSIIIIYVAIFGVMWFLMIRPQRKRQKAQREMLETLKVGDNIVTNSGMFGKIMDIGEDVYVVEFGTTKGIRIPVAKGEVAGIREPKMTPQPRLD